MVWVDLVFRLSGDRHSLSRLFVQHYDGSPHPRHTWVLQQIALHIHGRQSKTKCISASDTEINDWKTGTPMKTVSYPERSNKLNFLRFTMPRIGKIAQFQQQTAIWSNAINNTNAPRCNGS